MAPPESPRIVRGNTYVDATIRLDGRTFVACRFWNCTLEIGGKATFALKRCDVRACEWIVVGCAATAIRMLAMVQREYGARPRIETRHDATRS